MSKTIEIIVAPDGKSRVETKGFTGSECREAGRFVEQALGQHVDELLKSAFYSQTSHTNAVQNSNGR